MGILFLLSYILFSTNDYYFSLPLYPFHTGISSHGCVNTLFQQPVWPPNAIRASGGIPRQRGFDGYDLPVSQRRSSKTFNFDSSRCKGADMGSFSPRLSSFSNRCGNAEVLRAR